jgi:hypothetical protein
MRSLVTNVPPTTSFKMEKPSSTGLLRSIPSTVEFNEFKVVNSNGSPPTAHGLSSSAHRSNPSFYTSNAAEDVRRQVVTLHNISSSTLRLSLAPPKSDYFRLLEAKTGESYRSGGKPIFLAPGLEWSVIVEFMPAPRKMFSKGKHPNKLRS